MENNIFIAHPTNIAQINALKAVVKAFNVKFEIKKNLNIESHEPSKAEVLGNIRQGLKEIKLIEQGEIKGSSLIDFLSEL